MKQTLLFVCGMFFLTQFITGCSDKNIEAKSIEQIHKENGVPVEVEAVKRQPFLTEYVFHAVISGTKETSASAMIGDKVEKIYYSVGDRVTQDAVVVAFPTDNPAAQYFQAKVAYEHAEATLKRMKNLYAKGGISMQDFENARTQFEVTKANWDAVKQTVKVKAPIAGTLSSISVQETENVKPGQKLFTVSQTHKLKAKLWVSEDEVGNISTKCRATALWRGIELSGKVFQVDLSLDKKNQAFGVVVEFDNSQQLVPSGVNAEIHIYNAADALTIVTARKNIMNENNEYYVFVARQGFAKKRTVVTGREHDINIEIIQGLNPGDILITKGQMLLEDNAKIRVMNEQSQ